MAMAALMLTVLILLSPSISALNIMSLHNSSSSFYNASNNPWLQYIASYIPFQLTNIQQMAMSAMTPTLINNRTLIDLYSEAYQIINATGADSVLLELDPLKADKNKTNNQYNTNQNQNQNKNDSIVVLAVKKPDIPTHEDLIKKFNFYFVNLTESSSTLNDTINDFEEQDPSISTTNSLEYVHPTVWQIFIDFIRNQANALLGAMMIPINVSADAILKSTQAHAEYVMSGSSVGSIVSAPIILKSISIPNIVSQHITEMASHQLNNIDSFGNNAKALTDSGIQLAANGLNNGTYMVSDAAENAVTVADQYVIKPIGAFTGFHLNNIGDNIIQIGDSFTSTGLNIHLFGNTIGSSAVKLISAGATAIAWGLDDTVHFGNTAETNNTKR